MQTKRSTLEHKPIWGRPCTPKSSPRFPTHVSWLIISSRSTQVILYTGQAAPLQPAFGKAFVLTAYRAPAPWGVGEAGVTPLSSELLMFTGGGADRCFAGNDSTLPGCHSLNYILVRHRSTWAREHQLSERGLSQPAQTSSFAADWACAKASFQPLSCHGKRDTLPRHCAAPGREGRYRFILRIWKEKPCISWMNPDFWIKSPILLIMIGLWSRSLQLKIFLLFWLNSLWLVMSLKDRQATKKKQELYYKMETKFASSNPPY